jgi:hypothetical protein
LGDLETEQRFARVDCRKARDEKRSRVRGISQQIRRFEKLPESELSGALRKWKQKLTFID